MPPRKLAAPKPLTPAAKSDARKLARLASPPAAKAAPKKGR